MLLYCYVLIAMSLSLKVMSDLVHLYNFSQLPKPLMDYITEHGYPVYGIMFLSLFWIIVLPLILLRIKG